MSTWNKNLKKEMETPQFPQKGISIIIKPTPEPYETKVKGMYGDQRVYVVSSDQGLLYLSINQFKKIAQLFNNDFSSGITVVL